MITLQEAKVGMADKVDQMVVDEFQRGSYLLNAIPFDDAVSPGTGGSTLSYGYIRLKTPSTASFRALNTEYVNNEAKREKKTAECGIFGGNFKLDRVIIKTSGAVDELNFQMKEKITGAINLFHHTVINGDVAVNNLEFDGLSTMLTGSSTEYNTGNTLDISSSTAMDDEYNTILDMMDEFVSGLDGMPDMFLTNTALATKIKGVARRAGYYTRIEDAFGRSVDAWNDIPIIDLKNFTRPDGTNGPVVPIDSADGTTDLYAVTTGIDAFHGITTTGSTVIETHWPDLARPGVIKEGDVEMVAAVVLKNTLKAGVFRNIKVR